MTCCIHTLSRQLDRSVPAPSPPTGLPVEVTDEALVEVYRERNEALVFVRLVRRYERELYAFLRRFLGNEQQAEDVFQATFITVHQHLNSLRKAAVPPLAVCDRHQQSDRFKTPFEASDDRQSRFDSRFPGSETAVPLATTVPSREPSPFEEATDRETRQRIHAMLAEQPESTQALLHGLLSGDEVQRY